MSEETDKSKIIERIRKILAIAKDKRGNEHEARVAMRQAFALMTKHNISEAECAAAKEAGDITTRVIDISDLHPHIANAIFCILINYMGVGAITTRKLRGRRYSKVTLIGDEGHLDFAEYVLGFLRETIPACFQARKKEYKAKYRILDMYSYCGGFCRGLSLVLQKAEDDEKAEATETQNESFALAIQNNEKAIARFMDEKYSDTPQARQRDRDIDIEAFHSGAVDGGNTQINKPIAAE